MKKGWTITKLIAIGAIAVIRFLAKLLIYTSALLVTGSVFAGILALMIGPFFVALVALVINQFGAVTIFTTLGLFIELPLPVIFPKVVNFIVGPLTGILIDVLYISLKNRRQLFSFLSGFIFNFIQAIVSIVLFFSIGLFGTQNVPKFILTPIGLVTALLLLSLLGGLSGYFAFLINEKLKNTSVIRKIRK